MSTIAAISTPYGTGALSVVRVSGENAINISQKVFKSHNGKKLADMEGRTLTVGILYYNNKPLDEVVVSVFKAPNSYTGEDIVQISCHGGMYITKCALRSLLDSGAMMAGPGEFTKRAFMNGKMGLDKAESIMGLISSNYEKARNISFSTYCGSLEKKIDNIKDIFLDILSNLNAEIDYSTDDIPELSDSEILNKIKTAKHEIEKLIKSYSTGYIVQNGLRTAIIGAPNVGKSTLMNLLSNREKSIVTDIAGTTRDAIEESVILDDIPLVLIDTAGIRETKDVIEKIGAQKSREIAEVSDLILLILDSSRDITPDEIELFKFFKDKRMIVVVNKTDLNPNYKCNLDSRNIVFISAKNSDGIEDLSNKIKELIDFAPKEEENQIVTTERQRDVLVKSLNSIESMEQQIWNVPRDILADLISEPLKILSEFSGENIKDDIINKVFSNFCVGK